MSLATFLRMLQESGRVRVHPPGLDAAEAALDADADAALRELDRAARLSMPLDAPDFSAPAARWAAAMLYRGCQYLTFREVSAETVERGLAEPLPAPRGAAEAYSVDLTLRYLPDLHSLARGISPADPLVAGLLRLAREWPLSSVGIPGVGPVDVGDILAHPSLRLVYVDRVLEREDFERLKDPAVGDLVRAAIGAHGELVPRVARALAKKESPP